MRSVKPLRLAQREEVFVLLRFGQMKKFLFFYLPSILRQDCFCQIEVAAPN